MIADYIPDLTSNNAFSVETNHLGDPNAYHITKCGGNAWQAQILTSKPIPHGFRWEIQYLNAPQNNLHTGVVTGQGKPSSWKETTANSWVGDIAKNGYEGKSVDVFNPSPYPFPIYSMHTVFAMPHRLSSRLTAPLRTGDIARFSYDAEMGVIWISFSTDTFTSRYLFASGLEGKSVFPAVGLHYDGNIVVYKALV